MKAHIRLTHCCFLCGWRRNILDWRGCGQNGTLLPCWWECKLAHPLWRAVWQFLEKLNIKLSYNHAMAFLGIYPEKNMTQKYPCITVFIGALFTIVKTWKQLKYSSTEEWIKKMWYMYTMEYYSAIKKNKLMPFAATWLDQEIVKLSEASQRRRNIIWHSLYVESKKKWYRWTYKTVGEGKDGGKG